MNNRKGMTQMMYIILAIVILLISILFIVPQFDNASNAVTETINPTSLEDYVNKKPSGTGGNNLLAVAEEPDNSEGGSST